MSALKITILRQYLGMAVFVVLLRIAFNLGLGERSWSNLLSAAVEGGKLAAWVLAFGLLNALIDFRKILKFSPAPMRNFSTALTIALSMTPEMARNVCRVRAAAKLRSPRRGTSLIRSILIPVMSNAIDQSLNLAESMEARGFGQRAKTSSGDICLDNLKFAYVPDKPVLANFSINLTSGQFALITGATGSGKSTLLRLIQARVPGVAFVGQFPRQSFVADSVFDELAFSLVQLRVSKEEIRVKVSQVAKQFGLNLKANPQELSAGWQQRLAIAAALISDSKTLLLDEPFATMDDAGTDLLLDTLRLLKSQGTTVVIAEHRSIALAGLADLSLVIENGRLLRRQPRAGGLSPRIPRKGKVKVIFGENGSGKTTYLRALAEQGGVLVPQPASDLLFLDSVSAELGQADRDAKCGSGTTRCILSRLGFHLDESQNPRDLSEGQKLALALSIQLAKNSGPLMLDEPTLGFDKASRQLLATMIKEIAESGVEVIVATHDHEFSSAVATEVLPIGKVLADVS